MPRQWTAAQSAAINTRGKTLLVSAAAGSGKTAALTERVIRSLTAAENPSDISKMLIVTFTRTAAAELRQRIFAAVNEALADDPGNRHLSEQLIKLGSAKICTIDSFYLDLIRSNFDAVGISPSIRTADGAESDILAKSVMEETIEDFYNGEDGERFAKFTECFVNIRNNGKLSDIFLSLFKHIEAYPEGIEFLRISAERCEKDAGKDLFATHFGRVLRDSIAEEAEYILSVYNGCFDDIYGEQALVESYLCSFEYDRNFIADFIGLLEKEDYATVREFIGGYSPIRLKSVKGMKSEKTEALKETRDAMVKKIRNLRSRSFALSPESISMSMSKTAELTGILYSLIKEFDVRYSEGKRARNICTFSDIRRYALRILVDGDGNPTPTAREYSQRFTDIYIDEYQDVDRVQDLIFRAVSTPDNRFMVGDIKQSIFGFRGAEPRVFAQYRHSFPALGTNEAESGDCASVFMSNNFRCDKTVIDFTNTVCSYFFSECSESIGYTSDDDLIFSKSADTVNPSLPVKVAVILPEDKLAGADEQEITSDYDREDDGEISESGADGDKGREEAKYIASQIADLLANGRKADNTPIMAEDIAVLYRSKSSGAYVKKALAEIGIPYSENADERYFENPDVLLVLCLLNAIDNPHRDIYLAGLLRSPLFGFSMDELIKLRRFADDRNSLYDALCAYADSVRRKTEDKDGKDAVTAVQTEEYGGNVGTDADPILAQKCADFDALLGALRDVAASQSVDKLLRHIFSSELFSTTSFITSDSTNNILRLYEYARKFEAGSFKGLNNFIVYINKIIEEHPRTESAPVSVSPGKVTLMTIHQSKGLEFPVCFLCGAAKKFNAQDRTVSMLYNPELGVAMKISDETGFASINTPMREALIREATVEQTEEEMRLLYVALTRARERLIITAAPSSSEEKLLKNAQNNRRNKCRHTVCSCRSYLEWILAALADGDVSEFAEVEFIGYDSTCPVDAKTDAAEQIAPPDPAAVAEAKKLLGERFSYSYPYEAVTRLPAKLSVSSLKPDLYSSDTDAVKLFDEPKKYVAPPIFTGNPDGRVSPAERGTATHLFLQFCSYDYVKRNGVARELDRLIEKKYIPSDSRELVYTDDIEKFFAGDFFARLSRSRDILREQRFNILLPPSCLSEDADLLRRTAGEMIAVQGVIDLIFTDYDGNIHLCDYKTDRIPPYALENRDALTRLMTERHAAQLKYYAKAVRELFGKDCTEALIYSTHAACAVVIGV